MVSTELKSEQQVAPSGRRRRALVVALSILALCGLRLIHLDADMPLDMTRNVERGNLSLGLYVDEGYKTLDARNLFLFGTPVWHPQDEFPGWMKHSPLMQWAFYLSFQAFGQSLSSARLVTIASFLLLLVGFAVGTSGRYPAGLTVAGLVLLGLIHHVFLFSRIAIFVVPIATCVYCLLFFMARQGASARLTLVVAALVASSSLATFGIKPSAPLYFLPVLAGLVFAVLYGGERSRSTVVIIVLAMSVTGVATLMATHAIWWSRIRNISPTALFTWILDNGSSPSSGFLVCLGLVCAFHAVVTGSKSILGTPYGAGLVAMVVLGPLAVSFFPYHPLRYYVPLLPASLLLGLEWLHLRAWRVPIPRRPPWIAIGAGVAILAIAILNLARALNEQILGSLPLGSGPGLSSGGMFRYGVPLSVVLAVGLWSARRTVFTGSSALAIVAVLLVVSTTRDLYIVGRFLLNPSYQASGIAADIRRLVPPGASIGGDWAPFFTLGSDIKTLYVNRRYNRGERIETLRPDYFLYCDTADGEMVKRDIMQLDGVTLEPAVYGAKYAGRDVELHPLSYAVD